MTTEADSRSPGPEEAFRIGVESFLRDVHVALPGKIDSYDADTQKASVKPLVKRLIASEDGTEIVEDLAVIPGVPVVFPRGGGFFISMPVAKGDFCLLIFNSYPIDKYKAGSGGDTNPQDFTTHGIDNAVALMGFAPFSKAIKDADPDNVVIGKEQGTQIHVADGKIELGEKGASGKASIDSKIQDELTKISQQITILAADHLVPHNYIGPLIPASAVPTVPPPPSSASYSPSPTNSSLVTIKE